MAFSTVLRAALLGVLLSVSLLAGGDRALIEAVRAFDAASVKSLIANGADVDTPQPDGATALAWAAYLDNLPVAELLIESGADPNARDEYGDTPLTLAAANGNGPLVVALLKSGAHATATRANGETALMLAAGAGNMQAVVALIDAGAEIDATESAGGQTALMWAAEGNHTDVVEYLVKNDADVLAKSNGGFTALAFSATKNDEVAVNTMLQVGADPQLLLPDGTSVLMAATAFGSIAAAEALIAGGADVTVANSKGLTPLHRASELGSLPLVRRLLDKGADPNALTNEDTSTGRRRRGTPAQVTPLLVAAGAAQVDVMKALIEAHADTSVRAQNGASLLLMAVSSGRVAAVEYAYQHDDDLTVKTNRGTTVMHQIASSRLGVLTEDNVVEVINFLADKGAALDEEDARKRTPLSLADNLPITNAVNRLYELVLASGNLPKILPTDLQ